MRDKRSSSRSSTSPCAPLRDAYHTCFNRWYAEKFMKGHWDKEECVSEWQKYRACLSENLEDRHLIRFLEAEGNVKDDQRKGAAAAAEITGYQRKKFNHVTTSAIVLCSSAFLLGLCLSRASLYFRQKS